MLADVCPATRLRCTQLDACADSYCTYNRSLSPIPETRLTQAEQYALAMDEKRKGKTHE